MEKEEKFGLTYIILLVLTIAFLAVLFFMARGDQGGGISGAYTVTTERGGDEAQAPPKRVNINTATAEELEALSGIGPALAREIVKDRNANGEFASVEELMRVNGIGEGKLNAIRDAVTIEEDTCENLGG